MPPAVRSSCAVAIRINYSPPIQDGFNFPYFEGFNGSNPIIRRTLPICWQNPWLSIGTHPIPTLKRASRTRIQLC